jgi:hypothetical protein
MWHFFVIGAASNEPGFGALPHDPRSMMRIGADEMSVDVFGRRNRTKAAVLRMRVLWMLRT